jgi:phosphate starvation-inducible protein PhoH and related proteins
MAKKDAAVRKSGRHSQQFPGDADVLPFDRAKTRRGQNLRANATDSKRVECLTEAQSHYYLSLNSNPVTFGLGPAGTGKTHIAVGVACEMIMDKKIDQLIITRPMEGVEEDMGFLPGELEEKFDPYLAPVRAILQHFLGTSFVEYLMNKNRIVVAPLQFIRGATFDRAFMLLDEAQNTTTGQMKAFLTRIGKYTTVSINGDIEQIDIKKPSGMVDALKRFEGHPKFGRVAFEVEDIVRSDLVKDVILAYRKSI